MTQKFFFTSHCKIYNNILMSLQLLTTQNCNVICFITEDKI